MNLPNKLTVARVIAVPFFILAFMTNHFLIAFVIFILASLTDMLDGKIARKYNWLQTLENHGSLADKILVYSAFCLLITTGAVPAWMLIIILAREFTISGMRMVAAAEGIVIAAGLTGKIKTVLQMIAVPLLLLVETISNEKLLGPFELLANIFLWASLIMTVWSGIEYVLKNRKVFSM